MAVGIQRGRQQIRKGLAGAGAGFGNQVATLSQRLGHRFAELQLLRADFKVGQATGNWSTWAKQCCYIQWIFSHGCSNR